MFGMELKNEIKAKNGRKENGYRKDYMKIKFISDNDLPLNKPLKFHAMITIIRLFLKKVEALSAIFLDDVLYEL